MKYLFVFSGLFLIAAAASAQDTKVTQLPPVRTADNAQPHLQTVAVALPVLATANAAAPKTASSTPAVPVLATANASAPKTIPSVQAVPLRTSDIAPTAQPAQAAKTPDGSAPAKAALPPSSTPVVQATAQGQKQDSTGKTAQ